MTSRAEALPLTAVLEKHNKLVEFIREHGFSAYTTRDWKIRACMLYSSPEGSFEQWETVEPTWQAVRDWLGY